MRRKDREITDLNEIESILEKCEVCRLAMIDNNVPYIVPMNFGYELKNDTISLYFHSAKEGKKIDIINKNSLVCFEMDCDNKLVDGENACDYSYCYQSIIGNGTIKLIDDFENKKLALNIIMKKYSNYGNFTYNENAVNAVTVFKIVTNDFFGKKNTK